MAGSYEETLVNISLDADSTIGFFTGFPGMPGSTDPNWGRQYRFVKLVGAHQVGLADAATVATKVVGVLQNKPQKASEEATVAIFGVSMVHSGAAVAAGDYIKPDSTGRGITATAGTDPLHGLAIGAAAGADQLFPMLILSGHAI